MEELISLGRELENAAERGFLEHRTHQILAARFRSRRLRGYAPFRVDPALHQALRRTAQRIGIGFLEDGFSAASSDMGDLSLLLPSIIVGLPGTNGRLHQPEFRVVDETAACVFPGEVMAELVKSALAEAGR